MKRIPKRIPTHLITAVTRPGWHPSSRSGRMAGVLAAVVLVLMLAACTATTGTPTSVPPATQASASVTQAVSSAGVTGYPIKVYFSKFPENHLTDVYPVDRVSPTKAVATFAVQLLIAGPTLEERSAGYFSELNSILTGPSSCSAPNPTGGPDFTLKLDTKGVTPEQGTATLRFCRALSIPGVGTEARVMAEITATLTQFSNIKHVVILTQNGHCFGDASGQDRCLN